MGGGSREAEGKAKVSTTAQLRGGTSSDVVPLRVRLIVWGIRRIEHLWGRKSQSRIHTFAEADGSGGPTPSAKFAWWLYLFPRAIPDRASKKVSGLRRISPCPLSQTRWIPCGIRRKRRRASHSFSNSFRTEWRVWCEVALASAVAG